MPGNNGAWALTDSIRETNSSFRIDCVLVLPDTGVLSVCSYFILVLHFNTVQSENL